MSGDTPILDDAITNNASKNNLPSVHFGYRLLNHLIDITIVYLLIFFFAVLGFFLGLKEHHLSGFAGFIVFYALFVLYYYTTEFYLGRSIGKFITRTTVQTENGEPLTSRNAFIRSISRLVPFEAFSILMSSDMWHDKWSGTRVVKSS
jgi:uncharacterized RDD family membrane protein YckC